MGTNFSYFEESINGFLVASSDCQWFLMQKKNHILEIKALHTLEEQKEQKTSFLEEEKNFWKNFAGTKFSEKFAFAKIR